MAGRTTDEKTKNILSQIANSKFLKTNDQLRPSPPKLAQPNMHQSPPGTVGTQTMSGAQEAIKNRIDAVKNENATVRRGMKDEFWDRGKKR
jgi:hypothetical protein